MYKIEFIPTGHVFSLPDDTANELKEKYPADYKILEKNGRKYNDVARKKSPVGSKGSIRALIVED